MEMCLLEYFVVAAETENLESAARRLNMPATTLAGHLSELEGELGLVLLRQTFSGLELTAAGLTLLPHARLIVAEVEAAKRNVREIARPYRRTPAVGGALQDHSEHANRLSAP